MYAYDVTRVLYRVIRVRAQIIRHSILSIKQVANLLAGVAAAVSLEEHLVLVLIDVLLKNIESMV